MMTRFPLLPALIIALAAAFGAGAAQAAGGEKPVERIYPVYPPAPGGQSPADVAEKSAGCMTCHTKTDSATMHISGAIPLGCTDCHGGDAGVFRDAAEAPGGHGYVSAMEKAHVLPLYPQTWKWPNSSNPKRSYTLLNKESPEFLRFVNPTDYRVVREILRRLPHEGDSGRGAFAYGDFGHALGRRGL